MGAKLFGAGYLSVFCMELYLIIRAGIPFSEGIALLRDDEKDSYKHAVLEHLYQQLELGEPVAAALRTAEGFPVYVIEMVEIGQRTGHLEDVFRALAGYYERLDQLQRSLRNAVLYPAVLLVMMLFVVFVLLIKVLPIFQDVFQQLGAELSPLASMLMQVGQVLGRYGLGLMAMVIIGVLAAAVLLRDSDRRAAALQWFLHKSEGWRISRLVASSRLVDALVLTLSSGLNIDDSLDMAIRLVGNQSMQEKIMNCKRAMLLDSKAFAEASLDSGLFAPLYCRMIAVGFRTGSIDGVMAEVARRSAEQVDDQLESLLNRVEPTLVIIMSALVGLILLSVMLPLMSIMSAIG